MEIVTAAQKQWVQGNLVAGIPRKSSLFTFFLVRLLPADIFEGFLAKKYEAEMKSLLTLADPTLHYSIEIS